MMCKRVLLLVFVFVAYSFVSAQDELKFDSGPQPCPQVYVPTDFDLSQTQGDWYLYYTENTFNDQGCIGCNTAQISYAGVISEKPKYYINTCCRLSCADPRTADNSGVECGIKIGSGFISPKLPKLPNHGVINYENQNRIYTLFILGCEPRDFLVLFGCITYEQDNKTVPYHILRIYLRKRDPSAIALTKIHRIFDRYNVLNLRNFIRVDQGNKCDYIY